MNLKSLRALALGLLLPLCSAPGWAIDYYLQVGDIKGESTDKDHKDWIEILSFHWSLQAVHGGGGGAGGGGHQVFQSDFSWTQLVDRSVPLLFLGVAQGKEYPKATLDVVKPGDKPYLFFQMVFESVNLTSLAISGSGEIPYASAALQGRKLTMNYWQQSPGGGQGDLVTATFDFATGTMSGDPMALEGLFLSGGGFDIVPMPQVPEPATALLLPLGLGLMAWRRRQR